MSIQTLDNSIPNKEGEETVHRFGQKLAVDNSATVFGSSILTDYDQARSKKLVDRESIEGSKASNPASMEATEFSNGEARRATEYSNSYTKTAPGEGFEPSRPSRATSFTVYYFQACALPG